MLTLRIVLIALAIAVTSCSPAPGTDGSPRVVFATSPTGVSITGASPTDTILNFSNLLYNSTDAPVRLRSISLVSPSGSGIGSVRITAYLFKKGGAGVFEALQGNLKKECQRLFKPLPLTDVVTSPHSYSKWDVVLSFIASKPGRYGIFTMRVSYITAGQVGWQKLYLDVRFKAIPPKNEPKLVQPFHCSANLPSGHKTA
jgi:hypothetical protein